MEKIFISLYISILIGLLSGFLWFNVVDGYNKNEYSDKSGKPKGIDLVDCEAYVKYTYLDKNNNYHEGYESVYALNYDDYIKKFWIEMDRRGVNVVSIKGLYS